MRRFEANYDRVLSTIEAIRLQTNEHQIIKIVAVSKYVDTDAIRALYENGQRAFGENHVQDLVRKSRTLEALPLEWHYLGRIQTNKINALLEVRPALIQSCDSLEHAKAIDKRAAEKGMKPHLLLQINSAKEETKAGVMPEAAEELYLQIQEECPHLELKGVMTIGAHSPERAQVQRSFERTFEIFEKLRPHGAKYCSMGMSDDFEIAIRCGSNMLRLGRILFQED